ncbi:helix-turn-helix domain-containing protein [Bradyrhizobium sp. BRP22]|uniref:helix-turn-helix domain-containing protein n=1 Tax=Bradyrhizobium sp. BRP22 TaxID=2793821 RepID=UPI001CD5A12E|nr:helix-turn-helix domain-containing protein [Bradyrhizobium sp. BRP22]MCA1452869.1 helix-turn-helix domain-containing protein [Bradyrhizobium sp. BRP22]
MPAKKGPKDVDKIVAKIHGTRGLSVKVADACGIARTAVYQWTQVPLERVHDVAEVLGIPPEQVRPDFFRPKRRR